MAKNEKKIKCIATGKELILTPEEEVRQNFIKILIEEYGYEKQDIRIEYPVKRSPSDRRRSLPVDITVLENGKPKIFVETKKPTLKEGIKQLKNYMDFEDVKYGVWTNGQIEEVGIHFLEKIVKNNKIAYKDIFNIPEKGFYSIKEQIKKSELKTTLNLKSIFKQIRGFISANATGTTRDEKILSELMSILVCKIYDERYKTFDEKMEFIVIDDDPIKTSNNIKNIFEKKIKQKYPTVFTDKDSINLDDNSISYIVAQLQKYSITESSHQVVSDAFESIISYASKGSQGQFFTPKNIIDLMVNILKPERYKTLIDIACGTAGFLTSSMEYVWNEIDKMKLEESSKIEEKKEYAMTNLFGIEKDDFLAKISKTYMAILGDGKAGIFIEDSLDKDGWGGITKAKIKENCFDYILTNPPFGKDIKVKKETKEKYQFDDIDIMFLEKALELLKDGGILGIILPETIFHSPTNEKVRKEFFYKHNITCIIDIPHDTFRPYNNAKCDIIFLQKNTKQQEKILVINVENIGHNHLGETSYKYDIKTNSFDENNINDDIPTVINFLQNKEYIEKLKNNTEKNEFIKYINSKEIINSDLLVARNYFETQLSIDKAISLEELINENIISYFDGQGSPQGHLKGLGDKPYIRVKDIVNLEIYINSLDLIPQFEYDRLFNKNKELKEKDIVFVRRGSYRIGDVGILYQKDIEAIFTRELLILRVIEIENEYGITPYNLLFLLNSKDVKKQLKNKIMIDTTLPNIGDRWKKLLIPIFDKEKMKEISDKMEKLYKLRAKFWEDFSKIN